MATYVRDAKDPWWANLAVNVLGGLWNDYQQREANKKANAFFGALNEEYDKLSGNGTQGGLMAAPEQTDTGQGLLGANIPEGYNSNGWASAFHKADSPLAQFNNGVTGLLGASATPTTTVAPAPTQTQTIPSPIDFYRAAMGLAATKRFAMMNPDTVQNMITPYLKLNEAARQEQMRNDLARDYENATDAAGRKNVAARGLINQTIDNGAFSGLVGANAVTPMNLDLGGSILPGTFDTWSGKMTYGDALNKGLTPQQVADNAYRDRAFAEDVRRNNRDFTENNNRWWTTRGDSRVDAERNYGLQQRQLDLQGRERVIGQPYVDADGVAWLMYDSGRRERFSDAQGFSEQQKAKLQANITESNNLTREYERLSTQLNVLRQKNADPESEEVTNITARMKEIETRQNAITAENNAIFNSRNTSQKRQGGSLGSMMIGNANAGKVSKNGEYGNDRGDHRHAGTDFPAPAGTPITILPSMGETFTVVEARKSPSYGNTVVLETTIGGRKIRYRMAHMQDGSMRVKQGQKLRAGDIVGKVGSTGRSSGNHLHLEVSVDGQRVDPERFLRNYGENQTISHQQTIPPVGQASTYSGDIPTTLPPVYPPIRGYITQQEYEGLVNKAKTEGIPDGKKTIKTQEDVDELLRKKGFGVQNTKSSASTQAQTQPASRDVVPLPQAASTDIPPIVSANTQARPSSADVSILRGNDATPSMEVLASDRNSEDAIQKALDEINGYVRENAYQYPFSDLFDDESSSFARWADWAGQYDPKRHIQQLVRWGRQNNYPFWSY